MVLTAPPLVDSPTDVSGYSAGVDAVAFDPAASAWIDGAELQVRYRTVGDEDGLGRIGAYGAVPMGNVTLSAGFDWLDIPGKRHRRGTVGIALRPNARLTLGVSYRRLFSHRSKWNGINVVDIGAAVRPWRWLSLSAGLESLNRPTIGGVRQKRTLRVGAAVRPWLGEPWLTLSGDMRVTREPWDADHSRLLLDLGLSGIHALLAYAPEDQTVWVGASLALFGSEVRAVGVPPGGTVNGDVGLGSLASSVTVREVGDDSLLRVGGRTVELVASGDLGHPRRSVLDEPPVIRTLALELEEIVDDASIDTVILSIGKLDVGLATIDEVRRAIHRVRRSGKRVVAELSYADDKGYLLAVAADRILIDPTGSLRIDGFVVAMHYFADGLSKIGVRFDSVEVGRYKSGPDPLTRNEPRPEDVETQRTILKQAFDRMVAAIVEDRGLAVATVLETIDKGVLSATEALNEGFVDELTQPADPREIPTTRTGGEPYEWPERSTRRWGAPQKIVIVPVIGTIVMRSRDNLLPGESAVAPSIVAELESARVDPAVVGVVVRIQSGGGDVFASELIWRAVKRLAAVKPVVASFGDVAASGGYYLALPAHVIVSEASTVTGSIGIFALKADLTGLYKLAGVNPFVYKEGEHADWSLTSHAMRPQERDSLRRVLETYYDGFVERVAIGRDLEEKVVRELAQGKVYTGTQAMMIGLVDGIGGLGDAIAEVRTRAGLEADADVVVDIPVRTWTLTDLVDTISSSRSSILDTWEELRRRIEAVDGRALALMPMSFEVDP
ncbi:MAG: signal peptide peptidase SppA [Myxococcota bacterium]